MENLENLSLADLRAYAKKLGMKGVSTLRKKELAQRLSQEQQKHTMSEATASIEKQSHDEKKERRQNETAPRRDGREYRREYNQKVKAHYNNNASAETESGKIRNVSHDTEAHTQRSGILEVLQEGYGFIRCENFLPGEDDVYVSPALIRKYQLRTGDILTGVTTELSTLELQGMKMVDIIINGYAKFIAILLCFLFLSPAAAVISVVGVAFSSLALHGISRHSEKTAAITHQAMEDMSGSAIEYIRGLSIVKSFGQ